MVTGRSAPRGLIVEVQSLNAAGLNAVGVTSFSILTSIFERDREPPSRFTSYQSL
jgi:hypothetical protein